MMEKDYAEEAKKTVAIRYRNGSPMLVKSSYSPEQWESMVRACYLSPKSTCEFVEEGTPEADAILNAARKAEFEPFTAAELGKLDINPLRQVSKAFGLSGGGTADELTARILTAQAEGAMPDRALIPAAVYSQIEE